MGTLVCELQRSLCDHTLPSRPLPPPQTQSASIAVRRTLLAPSDESQARKESPRNRTDRRNWPVEPSGTIANRLGQGNEHLCPDVYASRSLDRR